jgi:hypothetical protein
MTVALNSVNVKKFVEEVQHQFQADLAEIQSLVRVKDVKGAKTAEFPVMGQAVSTERTSIHTPIPIANVATTVPTIVVKKYTVSDLVDNFDAETVPYSERSELVKSFGLSLKRRVLQILIDALLGYSTSPGYGSNVVAKDISGANAGLTIDAYRKAARLLDAIGVPPENRTMLAHTNGMHHMTKDTKVTSFDYNTMKVLMSGKMDGFYGLNSFWTPNMPEGGLPVASGTRKNWTFHKNAIGMAIGFMPRIRVDYSTDHGCHRVLGEVMANCGVIDPTGIVEVQTDTAIEDA